MSQEFRGFVLKINAKDGTSKRPPYKPYKLYSVKLEAEDGTEIKDWISCGFEAPKFKEGDYIKLQAETNDRGYLEAVKNSAQVAKNPPARAGKGSGGESPSNGGSSRGNYSKGGVDWNSAVARSIEMVDVLIKHDALTLSAAKGESGREKRRAEIEAMVDKYSVKYYNDVTTLRLLETVQDIGKLDTKPDGELPEKEDETPEKGTEDDDDNF